MNEKITNLMDRAEELARQAESWGDFSNALFDPDNGLVARAFPTRTERESFTKTREWRKIQQLMNAVVNRTGLVAGATSKTGGQFVVRLPVSLHESLVQEANREGVSLNQLVMAKLAVPLHASLQG